MSNIKNKLDAAVARGLNNFGEHLKGKVIDVTPMDTGELRRSIYIKKATADNLTVEVGSSGAIAPYNVYAHEVPKLNYTTPGTGYKFIEIPYYEEKDKIKDFIKAEVKK
jgi:hypothetical protein|nr:MAG TPA: putative tail component [Caudoviricetes sp.]